MNGRIDRFLFALANPRSVAILRIWISLVTAFVFYPREAPSVSAILRFPPVVELYDRVFLTQGYWACAVVLLVLFAVGQRSRLIGFLAVLVLAPCVPVLARLPGRYMMWFALAAVSLLRSTGPAGPIWPIRLTQLQLSALYLINALAKTTPGYLSGGALAAMAQQLPNFHLDLTQGYFPLGPWAAPLWLAASASALVEYSLAIGFWIPRMRWATAALGVAFHLGLMAIVAIARLDVAAVALYATFLLPWRLSDRDGVRYQRELLSATPEGA